MGETNVGSIFATVGLRSTITSDLAGITSAFTSVGNKVSSIGASIGSSFTSSISNGLSSLGNSFSGFTSKAQSLGSQMGIIKTAITGIATAKLVSGFEEATSTFVEFDDAMRRVSAAIGASEEDFKSLSEFARTAGTAMGYTATETANAMVLAAQAGLGVKEIYSGLPAVMALARAGATDLGTSVKTMTAIMTNYNLTAQDMGHIGDVIAQGANESTAEISEFAFALKYAAQAAAPLNISLEETTALMMAAADAGIRGTTAGTNFRQAFVQMISPTNAAVDALAKYNLTANDINLTNRDLYEVIDVLHNKQLTLNDAVTIFGQRAGPMMYSIITAGTQSLRENTTELENNVGYMEKMTDEMQGGMGGAVRELNAAFENLKITIGEDIAFFLKPMINIITDLTTAYSKLPDWVQKTVIAFAGLATIGLAALTVIGTFGVLIDGVGVVLGALDLTLAGVVGGFLSFAGPAAAVGVALLYIEDKTGLVSAAFDLLYDMGRIVWYGLSGTISEAISDITGYIDAFKSDLSELADDLGLSGVVSAVGTAWDNIKARWADGVQNVKEVADKYEEAAKKLELSTDDAGNSVDETTEIAGDAYSRWSKYAWEMSDDVIAANDEVTNSMTETATKYQEAVQSLMQDVQTKTTANISFMSGVDVDDLRRGIRTLNDELIILNDNNELVKVSADGAITKLEGMGAVTFDTTRGAVTILTDGLSDAQIESGTLDKLINDMGNDVVVLDNTKLDNLNGQITTVDGSVGTAKDNVITWEEALNNAGAVSFSVVNGEVVGMTIVEKDAANQADLFKQSLDNVNATPFTTVSGNLTNLETLEYNDTSQAELLNSTFGTTNLLPFSTIQGNISNVGSLTDTDTGKAGTLNSTLGDTNTAPFSTLFGNLGTGGVKVDTLKGKTDDTNKSMSTLGGFSFSTTISNLGGVYNKLVDIYDQAKTTISKLLEVGKSSSSGSSGSNKSSVYGYTESEATARKAAMTVYNNNVKINTVNNNGSSTSTTRTKSVV